jgi:hypothetical protein
LKEGLLPVYFLLEENNMETPLLDEIRKQASRQIIPLRGVGKTPGMLRRISNLQKGVKIKGRTKDEDSTT